MFIHLGPLVYFVVFPYVFSMWWSQSVSKLAWRHQHGLGYSSCHISVFPVICYLSVVLHGDITYEQHQV